MHVLIGVKDVRKCLDFEFSGCTVNFNVYYEYACEPLNTTQ